MHRAKLRWRNSAALPRAATMLLRCVVSALAASAPPGVAASPAVHSVFAYGAAGDGYALSLWCDRVGGRWLGGRVAAAAAAAAAAADLAPRCFPSARCSVADRAPRAQEAQRHGGDPAHDRGRGRNRPRIRRAAAQQRNLPPRRRAAPARPRLRRRDPAGRRPRHGARPLLVHAGAVRLRKRLRRHARLPAVAVRGADGDQRGRVPLPRARQLRGVPIRRAQVRADQDRPQALPAQVRRRSPHPTSPRGGNRS